MSTDAGDAVFIINDTKLYVPVLTLPREDNKDFIEQQNKGFQRSIYWNEYKTKEKIENANANAVKYISLDPSFQGVNRLFVMTYNKLDNANDNQFNRNSQQKYYWPRNDLNKYNVIIDGRNFYDNPIESDKLVAVDLPKQKELDADPRAIQQIEFKYMLGVNSTIYGVLEKSKEIILEFYKGTVKIY